MEPVIEFVRIGSMIAFLSLAAYFDIFNRKNVPVVIPYAMIAFGLILNLATLDFGSLISSATVALLILTVGYIVYRTGQIGGADVLIFTGIALLMPSTPTPFYPVSQAAGVLEYPFVFSVFIVSGFIALIGLAVQYIPPIIRAFISGRTKITARQALPAILISVAYLGAVFFLTQMCVTFPSQRCVISPIQGILISALALLAGFLMLFKDEISLQMVEWVSYSKIDEEDVIALSMLKPALG
ncbi:Uncharacterised protein [uncultured archaeon]|nr:Uncharacterised protein [uncultured archaeon]